MQLTHLRPAMAVIAAAAALSGCRSSASIDRAEIARLIQNEAGFKKARVIRVWNSAAAACERAVVETEGWRQLVSLGLIELRPRAGGGCEVSLPEQTRREISASAPGVVNSFKPAARSQGIELPVAERRFARITGVNPGEAETVTAQFLWHWEPNLLGRRLGVDTGVRAGAATLWLYERGWRVARLSVGE